MKHWPTKKLGEICEENSKSTFKVESADNSGLYPFFTSGGNILTHSEYLVDGENIFLSTGGYAHIKYFNGKAAYSTDTWSLRIINANSKYVFYQILSKIDFIDNILFRGSGLRHLQKKEFLNLQIPFPPLLIQQKIVYVLDSIQEAVEAQEKIIEKTKELKKSMMSLLFHYGTAILKVKEFASLRVGELTSEEFEKLTGKKLKKTEIGEIPEDWEVVRLGEVSERPQYGLTASAIEENTGIKLLRITDIQEEKVNWETVPFCNCTNYDFEKYKLITGDILIARIGATTGKTFFIKNPPSAVFGSYLIRIRPKMLLEADFLRYYFQLDLYWQQINLAKGGRLKGGINIPVIENLKISLPPLPEQREIADILQTIDQKIEIEQKKKELYEELFKTMLNKIFKGEIDLTNY